MAPADYQREAEGIAAEQRQVRAEFVFMMGGELADFGLDTTTLNEEVEAAGEGDLAAGRNANQGRADLIRAIRSMSRAAAHLAGPDLALALAGRKGSADVSAARVLRAAVTSCARSASASGSICRDG
jgi:hypothetical protein